MNMPHTAGPWHVKPPQFFGFNHAVVPDDDYVIAAAPELLEACKAMADAIDDCGYDCRQTDVMEAAKLAREAIAKADGRTP